MRTVGSVDSAARLLMSLADSETSVSLTELSQKLGLGKSSVHAILATLRRHGFVDQDPGGRYGLGLRAFEVGAAAIVQRRVGPHLTPPMERLAHASGEAVSLAVLDGERALIVHRFESTHMLRADLRVGVRMPLHSSASGKVLLAHRSPAEIDRLYPDEQLPALTAATLSTKSELLAELDVVAQRGYACNADELVAGVAAVAAPVWSVGQRVLGALSLAAPSARFEPQRWVGRVIETAREMSEAYEGGPAPVRKRGAARAGDPAPGRMVREGV
jgi:DNA-binding IclR family transcriptional regulator